MQSKIDDISKIIKEQIRNYESKTRQDEIGYVISVGDGAQRGTESEAQGEAYRNDKKADYNQLHPRPITPRRYEAEIYGHPARRLSKVEARRLR